MKSVARTITKPFEWLGEKAGDIVSGVGGILTPQMPEIPVIEPTPPAEPAGPGASASESSEAQAERLRVLKARKKTRTLLTGAQGILEAAGAVKKKLLGE